MTTTEPRTTTTHDPVAVEIHRRALDAITNEMAITLTRTSGSPVIYDVQDFATSLLDTSGEQLSLSATILFHSGSSLMGTRAIIDTVGDREVRPGDGWIVNDPYTGGAMHQADVAIITPLFYRGGHIGWAFANVHVLDTGGLGISGFAPTAHSILEEGLRFPPTRIISDGRIEPEWERYIAANVRIPDLVLNDLRSMIAANNVAQTKLVELIDRFGLETHQEYSTINKQLSEKALRARISRLPDGVYRTCDWIEYDGHGEELLLEVSCELTVSGSELNFVFDGAPQVNAFVNGTPGLVHGSLMSTVMTTLCYGDLPFNSGVWWPITVNFARAGTVVNATEPVPVTGAHAIAGTKVTKMVKDVLNQALALSEDEELRGRVAAQSWDAAGLSPLVGAGLGGIPTVVFFMDAVGGGGGGAQTPGDGLDTYGMTISPGVSLPSVEVNESKQPALYLWRKLDVNSGGPGTHRGGQSLDFAWAVHGTDQLQGAVTIGCAETPARGAGGGLPAATGTWSSIHDTNVAERMSGGSTVVEDTLTGERPRRPSNIAGLTLSEGDVLHMRCGAGGGLGDPLLREPGAVARDVHDEYITQDHARTAYGVVLDPSGAPDVAATDSRRRTMRQARLGGEPVREQRSPESMGISVVLSPPGNGDQRWLCGYCRADLGEITRNWREAARRDEQPVVDRFDRLGMFVRRRSAEPRVMSAEYYCPSCAGLLVADIYPEGFPGYTAPSLAT
ncbi:hydantoinase B/oxoprolinase family protein [Pseudonocardia endophytica]|uniref:N-methylhydantoinase B n=1 Tax=Pseudonocardia endophytica TaxID=401976 RepID=A0A4R1HKA2_PSEEN|nr:hydantoinase B/oxoprolinase family protein [Pseudonocardia endophytica]TCK22824.1 N-methylhydantoinase B [Pseudonocardia endophytica]